MSCGHSAGDAEVNLCCRLTVCRAPRRAPCAPCSLTVRLVSGPVRVTFPFAEERASQEGRRFLRETQEQVGKLRQPEDTARAWTMAVCFGHGVISSSPRSCTRAGLGCPLVCVAKSSIPGPNQGEAFSLELCLTKSFSTCADSMKIISTGSDYLGNKVEGEMLSIAAARAANGQRINPK